MNPVRKTSRSPINTVFVQFFDVQTCPDLVRIDRREAVLAGSTAGSTHPTRQPEMTRATRWPAATGEGERKGRTRRQARARRKRRGQLLRFGTAEPPSRHQEDADHVRECTHANTNCRCAPPEAATVAHRALGERPRERRRATRRRDRVRQKPTGVAPEAVRRQHEGVGLPEPAAGDHPGNRDGLVGQHDHVHRETHRCGRPAVGDDPNATAAHARRRRTATKGHGLQDARSSALLYRSSDRRDGSQHRSTRPHGMPEREGNPTPEKRNIRAQKAEREIPSQSRRNRDRTQGD